MRRKLRLRFDGGGPEELKRKRDEDEDECVKRKCVDTNGWKIYSTNGEYEILTFYKSNWIKICLLSTECTVNVPALHLLQFCTQCGIETISYIDNTQTLQNGILYINKSKNFCIKKVKKTIWDNIIRFLGTGNVLTFTSFIQELPRACICNNDCILGYKMNYYIIKILKYFNE